MERGPKAITIATLGSIVFGLAFIYRCELSPVLPGGWPTCWTVGGAIAGVPFVKRMAEKQGFVEGYNTYNPALRKPREEDEIDAGDGSIQQ